MKKTVPLYELAERMEDLLRIPDLGQREHPDGPPAKGFTIGKGKLLYWWISPMPLSNTYRIIQAGYETKPVSIRYGVDARTMITIHY